MFRRLLFPLVCVLVFSVNALACDACGGNIGDPSRGGGSGLTAGIGDVRRPLTDLILSKKMNPSATGPETTLSNGPVPDFTSETTPSEHPESSPRRWSLDTSFDYRCFQRNTAENSFKIVQSGHDQHGYRFDYFVSEHISYAISDDLAIGIGAGFRSLHKINVDDPARLGQHETSAGATDPTFDVKYRFMHQTECFPLDLAVFAAMKTNFGETQNRRPSGELFETEDQPGTGSLNGTLGLAASRGWGKWGMSASASYTYKGEGSQKFKEGDVTHMTLSGSRLLSPDCYAWKLYGSVGLQGIIEKHAQEDGITDPDHGGKFMYFVPGIAAKPTDRLVLSLSAPIPVIQDENGTHQKQRWNLHLGVGVRF